MAAALRDELDAVLRASALPQRLGVVLEEWGPGWARTALAPGPDAGNLGGSVHGGLLFVLADAAFEAACNSYGRRCVALDMTCHYVAPARVGERLVANATEVSRSRRTASYRVDVCAEDGALRAWYLAVAYRTQRWHLGEQRWPATWRDAH